MELERDHFEMDTLRAAPDTSRAARRFDGGVELGALHSSSRSPATR
jgi:hypothetical protein